MIELNHASSSLHAMEEALVLRSLYREDGLTQEQIGVLVSRDKSWVSRRLLLAEELDEDVQQDIRLGLVSVVTGREVARLPRGNQKAAVASILKYRLSTREVARLVSYLLTCGRGEGERILASPWELFEHPPKSSDLKGSLAGMHRVCQRVSVHVEQAAPEELERLGDLMDMAANSAGEAIRQIQLAWSKRGEA